jgi:hypothetical protein
VEQWFLCSRNTRQVADFVEERLGHILRRIEQQHNPCLGLEVVQEKGIEDGQRVRPVACAASQAKGGGHTRIELIGLCARQWEERERRLGGLRLDGGSQRIEQRGFPRPTVACEHAHGLGAVVRLEQVLKGRAMRRAPGDEPRVGGQGKGIFGQSVKVFHQRLFSGPVIRAAERGAGRAPATVAGSACRVTR